MEPPYPRRVNDERTFVKKTFASVLAASALALSAAVPFAFATTGSLVHIAALSSGLRYDVKTVHAHAGVVTLEFTNRSQIRHNVRLEIGEKEYGGTKTIAHGTTKVTLHLKKGTYHFYCSVPGHEDAGMSGTLIVS